MITITIMTFRTYSLLIGLSGRS